MILRRQPEPERRLYRVVTVSKCYGMSEHSTFSCMFVTKDSIAGLMYGEYVQRATGPYVRAGRSIVLASPLGKLLETITLLHTTPMSCLWVCDDGAFAAIWSQILGSFPDLSIDNSVQIEAQYRRPSKVT